MHSRSELDLVLRVKILKDRMTNGFGFFIGFVDIKKKY